MERRGLAGCTCTGCRGCCIEDDDEELWRLWRWLYVYDTSLSTCMIFTTREGKGRSFEDGGLILIDLHGWPSRCVAAGAEVIAIATQIIQCNLVKNSNSRVGVAKK